MIGADATGASAAPLIGRRPGLLRSFWIGGFEGADHRNRHGRPLAMSAASGHDDHLEADYDRLVRIGVRTVRESVGWRLAERDGRFDFARLDRIARAAGERGIQVLWTLMHYGFPADVSPLDDGFVQRFARFAAAAARRVRALAPEQAPFYTPINEISFLSWALSSTGLMHPFDGTLGAERGYAIKRRLAHATLCAIDAIRAVDARARFVLTDPLICVHAAHPAVAAEAARIHDFQYQAFDLLAGRAEPRLGGSPAHLDIVGVNYYHDNQWVHPTGERLGWHERDARRAPLSQLLAQVWQRYGRPVVLAETSHFGAGRARWVAEVAAEVAAAERAGVPVDGVCLYPIVDRPDWCDDTHWHRSGLWDAADPAAGRLDRRLSLPYARTLRRWQRRLHGDRLAPDGDLRPPFAASFPQPRPTPTKAAPCPR